MLSNKIYLDEKIIISKYLKKLNFNKEGTYKFQNDASFLKTFKNKIIVTTDSISEKIDFFKNDNPRSIANKITTCNLSDLSAMGAYPYAYTLNLFLPKYIDHSWLEKFTDELFNIQKKLNFYLLGGDLSKANNLSLSATFFGFSTKKIISQNNINLDDDIWITGNIGDSYVGLQLLKKNIKIKNKLFTNYFLKKYYYPEPCMIGSKISNYVRSMKDISDGFLTDLKKMLNDKYGAQIILEKVPLSLKLKYLVKNKYFKKLKYLNSGDDYELIIVSNKKFRNKILKFSTENKIKITRVGKIIKNSGIYNDSNKLINISREYDHFL